MSILQIIVIAVICLVASRARRDRAARQPAGTGCRCVYMAAFAGALALLGQTWAQAHLRGHPHARSS